MGTNPYLGDTGLWDFDIIFDIVINYSHASRLGEAGPGVRQVQR